MKRIVSIILSLAVVFSLTACARNNTTPKPPSANPGQQQPPAPVYGGSLVVAVPTDPDRLDPHKATAAATEEIIFNVYEGLLKSDPKGELVPALAESWTVDDGGKLYTFKLRQNVVFHNGRTMTAEDVKFTFDRIRDKATGHPRQSEYQDLTEIKIVDPSTVQMRLAKPQAPFLSTLAAVSSAIVPPEAVATLDSKPIGTGPFKLVDWQRGQAVKLEKNQDYWQKGLPYLDTVTFRIMADPNTALMNLKAGQVDIIPRVANESADEIKRGPDTKLIESPMNLVQLLVLNNARAPLDNPKVRQALNYAINKDEIIQGAAWGYGKKLGSNMSPVMEAYYTDLTNRYPYDPAKAKQLLVEAGYPNGFELALTLPAIYELHVKAGEVIADQLAKVGIKAKIQKVEWAIWLEDVYKGRKYDMTVTGLTGKLDPHSVLGRYESKFASNFFNFRNDEYDQLIASGITTTDVNQRKQIYKRAQEILADQAAAVYIMDPTQLVALRRNVHGWQTYPVYVADVSRVYKTK